MSLNPSDVCTWRSADNCLGCQLKHRLNCRWSGRLLLGAFGVFFGGFAASAVGLYAAGIALGTQLPLILFVVALVLFFNVAETWLLCRHCPFYAREGGALRCPVNHGCLKLWRFSPRPMNRTERRVMRAAFTLFFTVPTLLMGYGYTRLPAEPFPRQLYLGLLLASLFATASSYVTLRVFLCRRCVNFSCPLNLVPEDAVQLYLDRNPVLREAWDAAGLDHGEGLA